MKIYEDEDRMVIMTGVPGKHKPSTNIKTGPMAQTWVLSKNHAPLEAAAMEIACGDCDLRHDKETGACYNILHQAPSIIYHQYKDAPVEPYLMYQRVFGTRITAYGEAALAANLMFWDELVVSGEGHTAYTHQWRNLDPKEWGWMMASVENMEQAEAAWDLGWKTFRVTNQFEGDTHKTETECLYYGKGHKRCYTCMLCDGGHVNIVAPIHGGRHKRADKLINVKVVVE